MDTWQCCDLETFQQVATVWFENRLSTRAVEMRVKENEKESKWVSFHQYIQRIFRINISSTILSQKTYLPVGLFLDSSTMN